MKLSGSDSDFPQFKEYFKGVLASIEQRGPDCFGLWGKWDSHSTYCLKEDLNIKYADSKYGDWEYVFERFFNFGNAPSLVLANFRGIPTTECFEQSPSDDAIQPFMDEYGTVIITHNGQLSNEKELSKKKGYKPFTKRDIDSYYFVHVLKSSFDFESFLNSILEIEGSYAFAGYDQITEQLYFARSFLGLFFANVKMGDATYLVWASEAESLGDERIMEMPPYSVCILSKDNDFTLSFVPFRNRIITKHNTESCVIVLSGGLDSATCLAMVAPKYKDIHLLHFLYGARAQSKEVESVQALYDFYKQKYPDIKFTVKFIPFDFIKQLGGSTLTDHSLTLAQGEKGVETTHEWVPARNIAMIGLAVSYCDRFDIGAIVLGLNREEAGVYEDNSSEFYKRMQSALELGSHSKPKLLMPLGNCMKHHIWKKARELDVPLHLSWSCYEGGTIRCGQCGPCIMRQRAAAINGERDMVEYENPDLELSAWIKGSNVG